MTVSKRITADMLREHNACEEQVGVFIQEWPDGCTITKKHLARAIRLGLDMSWCERLLHGLALAEYKKVMRLALAKYKKVTQLALLAALKKQLLKKQFEGDYD